MKKANDISLKSVSVMSLIMKQKHIGESIIKEKNQNIKGILLQYAIDLIDINIYKKLS